MDLKTQIEALTQERDQLRQLLGLRHEIELLKVALFNDSQSDRLARKIIAQVCLWHKMNPDVLISRNNAPRFATPRFICWLLIRQHTDLSFHSIGEIFDKRDHGTVMYGVKRIMDLTDTEPKLKASVERIWAKCVEREKQPTASNGNGTQ